MLRDFRWISGTSNKNTIENREISGQTVKFPQLKYRKKHLLRTFREKPVEVSRKKPIDSRELSGKSSSISENFSTKTIDCRKLPGKTLENSLSRLTKLLKTITVSEHWWFVNTSHSLLLLRHKFWIDNKIKTLLTKPTLYFLFTFDTIIRQTVSKKTVI